MSTSLAPVVCLASASPRRRALLAQIGVPHSVLPAHIEERLQAHEAPHDYVLRLACAKALAVWQRAPALPVLAADTAVVLDGTVHGKPRTREDAHVMLNALSGRTHTVLTAVALCTRGGLASDSSRSSVRLRALSRAEIEDYWQTGEPCDKAGGYAIQGLGAVFIESLEGSYSGVMGLPLYETARLLRAAGVPCWVPGANLAGGAGEHA